MTVTELFDAALVLINGHNAALGDPSADANHASGGIPPGYIAEPQQVIAAIKASGGTSEERLKSLSYEDVLATLPTSKIGNSEVKPIALARDIAKLFRGAPQAVDKRLPHPAAVSRMTLRQKIENLDPSDFNSVVAKALREDFGTKRFIVYKEGRTIDVENTFNCADELRQGYAEIDTITVDGDVKRVYSLGELPDNLVDENPFYVGRPLRKGQICDQTNRSLEGTSLEVRQFVRVGINAGTFKTGLEQVHGLLDMILGFGENAFKSLRVRYQQVALRFDELKDKQQLPTLRIPLNPVRAKGPFEDGKKVTNQRPCKMHGLTLLTDNQ